SYRGTRNRETSSCATWLPRSWRAARSVREPESPSRRRDSSPESVAPREISVILVQPLEVGLRCIRARQSAAFEPDSPGLELGTMQEITSIQPVGDDWEWQHEGLCRTRGPELFFHPDGERGSVKRAREARAKALCL